MPFQICSMFINTAYEATSSETRMKKANEKRRPSKSRRKVKRKEEDDSITVDMTRKGETMGVVSKRKGRAETESASKCAKRTFNEVIPREGSPNPQ